MSIFALFTPRRLTRLLVSDAANVARDPLMLFVLGLAATPALALWLWGASMDSAAEAAFGLSDLSRYLAPIALLVPASLIGWIAGFLLLEDRDDGLMPALAVTPAGKEGFMAYRIAVTALATALVTGLGLPVVSPGASVATTLTLVFSASAASVLYAIVLPAIARNKVEGLALTKLTNLVALVPLLALVPSPWRYLAAVVPTYWVGEVMLASNSAMPLAAIILATTASYLLAGAILFRRFAARTL